MRMASDAVMLGWEAQRVIGLRVIKLSGGGPAARNHSKFNSRRIELAICTGPGIVWAYI